MKNNFFRKDLNLNNRWWHRLFLVIFLVSFVVALISLYYDLSSANNFNIPQWKMVDSLEERIVLEVKQIHELKKPNERIEHKDRSYAINLRDKDSLYDNIYCSSDLENRIDEIQNKSKINSLYLMSDNNNRFPVSKESLIKLNFIKSHNIKCLAPDAYTKSDNSRVEFLELITKNSLLYNDLVFYEKSHFLTAIYILKSFLLLIALFIAIIIIYYKIFIYIIFGSRKDKIVE